MKQSSRMTEIKRSEIPDYLHKSEFYLSLDDDESDDEISIPSNCMKKNLETNDACDMEHLLLTMRFWILPDFPPEAIAFMLKHRNLCAKMIQNQYQLQHPTLSELLGAGRYDDRCALACKCGRLDFLIYFVKDGSKVSMDAVQNAANGGYLECMIYALDLFQKSKHRHYWLWGNVNVEPAARAGQLNCLKYLIQKGLPPKMELCTSAAENDQLEVLKYVLAVRRSMLSWIRVRVMWEAAVKKESLQCLEFLLEKYSLKISILDVLDQACYSQCIAVLKLLLDRDLVFLKDTVTAAAWMGSLKCLEYLHDEWNVDCWVSSTMEAAVMARQANLVLQLLKQKCPFDRMALLDWLQSEEQMTPNNNTDNKILAKKAVLADIRIQLMQV